MTILSMPSAKSASIQLRYFLKEKGYDIPLSLVQEGLARTRGAASFQVLLAAEQNEAKPAEQTSAVKRVKFSVLLRVLDLELIDNGIIEYGLGSTDMFLADKVGVLCVEQNRNFDFLRNGCPLVYAEDQHGVTEDLMKVTIEAEVLDEEALRKYAQHRVMLSWGASAEPGETVADCLYEVLCASNHREAPCNLGFEYVSMQVESQDD